jgi:sugar phosphate isomerase/epimerase
MLLSRRALLAGGLGMVGAGWIGNAVSAQTNQRDNSICAFVKFLQSLSYDALAEELAALGFDGIEATVREKGQIEPHEAEEELPKLVEALRKCGLEITIMASGISRVDQPHTESVLRVASQLGIGRYRMGYYRYDLTRSILPQLDALQPAVRELAALNRDLGLTGLYQNHAGSRYVGTAVWDLEYLLRDIPVEEIAAAFDIRHATVEGGQAWPLHFQLIRPHLGASYVKDFVWEGRRPVNVPLGRGQVDPQFFAQLREAAFRGPISLHVEYLPEAGVAENLKALKADLATLQGLLG